MSALRRTADVQANLQEQFDKHKCEPEESGPAAARSAIVGTSKMRREFRSKLNGDESRDNGTASFTLPFDTREVWGKAKVLVKVTINGYTWRNTVGNRGRDSVHRCQCGRSPPCGRKSWRRSDDCP